MAADKQTKLLAKQLFKLSVVNGVVSPEQVAGVLGWVEKTSPRRPVALLKAYHHRIALELAKSRAEVEHAGPVTDATLKQIEAAMTKRYARPVTASAQPNARLLAGLRVRVGSDVYESSVAAQLASLSV
jgi:F-type H+-transporting ATPase subunit delta